MTMGGHPEPEEPSHGPVSSASIAQSLTALIVQFVLDEDSARDLDRVCDDLTDRVETISRGYVLIGLLTSGRNGSPPNAQCCATAATSGRATTCRGRSTRPAQDCRRLMTDTQ